MHRSRRAWAALVAAILPVGLATVPSPGPASAEERSKRPRSVRVVAAGDIACAPGETVTETKCQHAATARVARKLRPRRVVVLGDLQYDTGSLASFREVYDDSWGRLLGKTHPVPGNNEYGTEDASGYYKYFRKRQPGAPGYYARRYGSWRVYLLNSNCDQVSCKRQLRWLRNRLGKHRARCSLMAMHHPRYSSRPGFDPDPWTKRFSRLAHRRGVDLVLSGHEHNYERFQKLDGHGARAKDGFVQFVVGTGGKSHRTHGEPATGSAYRDDENFGVLRLQLRARGYRHVFVTIGGERLDRGSRRCV